MIVDLNLPIQERPFLFKNATGSYNGLIVDLMNELQKRMQFTYTIIPARGNKYGNIISSENGTVTATGMMAQLLDCVRQTDKVTLL